MKSIIIALLIAPFGLNAQCKDSFSEYRKFREQWNKHVEIFKRGTWKLPEVDCAVQPRDSFDVVHPLERSGINFMTTLTKTGCISKASILAKKEDNLDVEGLVAMMYLLEFFNPELNDEQRQKTFDEMRTEAADKRSYVNKQVGKNRYVYEPGLIVNVLTVVVGRN